MIHEIAVLTIEPANADAFEAAVASCAPLFRAASGCHAMRLEREIEDASRYRLIVDWDTVDDHMITFRASSAFAQWRDAVGPFFAASPVVVHTQAAGTYF